MKKLLGFVAVLMMVSGLAQAASLKNILESIASSIDFGNGSYSLETYDLQKYSEQDEIANLDKQENGAHSNCRYDIVTGIDAQLKDMGNFWEADVAAKRLGGLAKKGLIRQIISSSWDGVSGDSEYCLISEKRIYTVDGSVLIMHFDETD